MNRKKFERRLVKLGCYLFEHGASHDKWRKKGSKSWTEIPRHKEIQPGIIKSICHDLGIPLPSEK